MPTPVSAARQCLTEEAARALDDAVAVARRRCHAQTTSLHAVSALLALPSSSFREACSRARSCAYSPRLHFRALELSVGVSLDRLPSSKAVQEPTVSNSLMAAIKRSQANQRRQPESFHFHQLHVQQQSASLLKVELKQFILSILDDPIVSRVLGEAGFRSYDVKFAIMHPPITQSSRFSRTKYPPLFLCNLTDSDPGRRSLSFPFPGSFVGDDGDDTCRRIGEILVRKSTRNPLLIGVCAAAALQNFTDCVQKGKSGVFPAQISGLGITCIYKEISEFLNGTGSREKLGLKLKQVGLQMEKFSGPGVAVNYGELNTLVGDDLPEANVSFVVSKLTDLMKLHGEKLWLVGAAGTYETYEKLLTRFPAIEREWDLHLLPITSSKSSFEESGSKSSLIGSFVPFGGFFSTPPDLKFPQSSSNQSFTRCHDCTEKYEQEIAAIWKAGATLSVSDAQSETLPAWLQMAGMDASKTKVDDIPLSAKVLGVQRKWNDICRSLHHEQPAKKLRIPQTTWEVESVEPIPLPSDNERSTDSTEATASPTEFSKNRQTLPWIQKSSSSRPVVATDLGLGTIYEGTNQKQKKGLELNYDENIGEVSFRSDLRDFKSLKEVLTRKVGWQDEAISAISEVVSLHRSGRRRHCGSTIRGDIWLTFFGPDKVGKKKIAVALAEALFGSRDSMISVDLGCLDGTQQSGSLFESQDLDGYNVKFRGTLIADYIARELSKKLRAVVYLENVDKADPLSQSSLSQAIKTGRFPDSRGREISIDNVIFVVTSTVSNANQAFGADRKPIEFPEERILSARHCQMQISHDRAKDLGQITRTNVSISLPNEVANRSSLRKRKHDDSDERIEREGIREKGKGILKRSPMPYLDLNLPVEEIEEETSDGDCDSDSISECSEKWVEDFLNQVDGQVVFKPYDFDANAEKIRKEIESWVERALGCKKITLEIDYGTMVQILAADWLSEKKETVEAWIDEVLGRSLVEAEQNYHLLLANHPFLKLSNSETLVGEEATGTFLPARIHVS